MCAGDQKSVAYNIDEALIAVVSPLTCQTASEIANRVTDKTLELVFMPFLRSLDCFLRTL